MEIINFRAVEKSTQDVFAEIKRGNSKRWTVQSQKSKYVNGKPSGVIEVGYTASINNSDYLLEEDASNNLIQITAKNYNTSGTCVLTQNESGNKINIKITTPEEEKKYWEIRFYLINTDALFYVTTNIGGERGYMSDNLYNDWIINHYRHTINIYIIGCPEYPVNSDLLSWSCFDKDGKAFIPVYNLPDNSYFTTKTTGLGTYTLTKISTPPVNNDTPILSSGFNPTKKYPLDLNFYWANQPPT